MKTWFCVYLVIGMLFKRVMTGVSGAEAVPNIRFWRALPGLVSAGCGATKRLCCGSSGDNFAPLHSSDSPAQPLHGGPVTINDPIGDPRAL